MTITAAYCPPRFSISQQEFENFFSSLGPRFIVGADWNAKHTICSSRLITTRGRNLYQATRSNRYSYLSTGEPTYWPTDREKMPDLLEFFVVQGVSNNYTTVESNYDIFYDHSPVILTLSTTIICPPKNILLTSSRTNWDEFRQYLDERVDLKIILKSPDDINEAVDNITKLIQQSAQYATPKNSVKNNENNNIPKQIADLIVERRQTRRLWMHTRDPQIKTVLNRLTRNLHHLLKTRDNEILENCLVNLNTQDNSLWRPTKILKRPQQRVPTLKISEERWA